MNFIFNCINVFAFLGWLLLFVAPSWKNTQFIINNGILVTLASVYFVFVARGISTFNLLDFSSFDKVKILFSNDYALITGWIHYLIFDLFVGLYIVRKSIEIGISRWIYSLILPFTFLFGPIGFLIFNFVSLSKSKY